MIIDKRWLLNLIRHKESSLLFRLYKPTKVPRVFWARPILTLAFQLFLRQGQPVLLSEKLTIPKPIRVMWS